MVKIAVNGLGTIGKRVAAAVRKQEDMDLVAVADVAATGELRTVMSEDGPLHGVDLYGSTADGVEELRDAGLDVAGELEDVIDEIDLVVDATPKGIDMQNKENLYEPNDVKAIFQGGADGSIADVKFNANANYDEAEGEQFVKLVSCNTTSLCRSLHAMDDNFGVDEVIANLVRRGGDPKQDSRGPINSIIPVQDVPSHHGPDVQEVMPYIDITTLAVKVPTTLSHVHMVNAEMQSEPTREEVLEAFREEPRVNLVSAGDGYGSTAKIVEKMRDMERPRSDMEEVAIWEETVTVDDKTVYWIHMTHQESIVVPDNIDAIRAMLGLEDRKTSMRKTDRTMPY